MVIDLYSRRVVGLGDGSADEGSAGDQLRGKRCGLDAVATGAERSGR